MYKFSFIQPALGQIQIDDFKESFQADHSFWAPQQYEAQWRAADRRLSEEKPACFATSVSDPARANFFRTWVCYPQGDGLVFQEHLIFASEFESPVDLGNLHRYVRPYQATTEEGDAISEWRTRR